MSFRSSCECGCRSSTNPFPAHKVSLAEFTRNLPNPQSGSEAVQVALAAFSNPLGACPRQSGNFVPLFETSIPHHERFANRLRSSQKDLIEIERRLDSGKRLILIAQFSSGLKKVGLRRASKKAKGGTRIESPQRRSLHSIKITCTIYRSAFPINPCLRPTSSIASLPNTRLANNYWMCAATSARGPRLRLFKAR